MTYPKAFLTISIALLIGAVSASAADQPGRLLEEYPEADITFGAKYHPDRALQSNAESNLVNHRMYLETDSQRIADQILAAEAGHRCNTVDARYFQIKAVHELRQSELDLGGRDLLRARDALRVGCAPVQLAQAEVGGPAENLVQRHHRRRHRVVHHRHCICR